MTSLGWSHVAKSHQQLRASILYSFSPFDILLSFVYIISSQFINIRDNSTDSSTILIYSSYYCTLLAVLTPLSASLWPTKIRTLPTFPHRRLDPLRFDLLSRLSSHTQPSLHWLDLSQSRFRVVLCVCVFFSFFQLGIKLCIRPRPLQGTYPAPAPKTQQPTSTLIPIPKPIQLQLLTTIRSKCMSTQFTPKEKHKTMRFHSSALDWLDRRSRANPPPSGRRNSPFGHSSHS